MLISETKIENDFISFLDLILMASEQYIRNTMSFEF